MADTTRDMIISEEQVRRVIEYLQTSESGIAGQSAPRAAHRDPAVPDELLMRVSESLRELPDVRADRVAEARARASSDRPGADEIASKLIGRVISDAVR